MSHISPLHKSPSIALSDPHWRDAIYDEYNALIKNDTWILVLKPPNVNVKYVMELLERAHMSNCNAIRTLVDTKSKLGYDGDRVSGPTLYRSLTESSLICSWYIGLWAPTLCIPLVVYTDADWAGCPTTRRSASGYCVFLRDNLLSWSVKQQHTLSRLSAKAEYRGVANVVAETAWLRNLLKELHTPLYLPPLSIVPIDMVARG
nr:ribonuclease H-like domain-containing protein [Tanacetum cinerariifolium]